jgi:hypothetical protein
MSGEQKLGLEALFDSVVNNALDFLERSYEGPSLRTPVCKSAPRASVLGSNREIDITEFRWRNSFEWIESRRNHAWNCTSPGRSIMRRLQETRLGTSRFRLASDS